MFLTSSRSFLPGLWVSTKSVCPSTPLPLPRLRRPWSSPSFLSRPSLLNSALPGRSSVQTSSSNSPIFAFQPAPLVRAFLTLLLGSSSQSAYRFLVILCLVHSSVFRYNKRTSNGQSAAAEPLAAALLYFAAGTPARLKRSAVCYDQHGQAAHQEK